MYRYKVKIKDAGGHTCEPSYTSPTPVSEEFLVDFFGLENGDVESYEIIEE